MGLLQDLKEHRPRPPRDQPRLRPDWDRAACRDAPQPLFFTRQGMKGRAHVDDAARRVCLGCPIQPDCLVWALSYEAEGTWGGVTAPERWKLGGVKPVSREATLAGVSPATAVRTCERLVKRGHSGEVLANALELAARIGANADCPPDGVGLSLVSTMARRRAS